ncbi:hypothetical protein JZ751_008954 [Albula glossodonta]|uniref:Uncharacterized protein n=1 Tax=Albula glossodonta TaxID=121402 RepID=A0A8T2P0E1_9TELE|nr:hypothetical protein JZ751_008954 [Albula glossodonta]
MEFACSHVVCNWMPERAPALYPSLPSSLRAGTTCTAISRPLSVCDHDYDNRVAVIPPTGAPLVPPPLPPRKSSSKKQPRPRSMPPPVPPRGQEARGETPLRANVNVLSLTVGRLVDISKASCFQSTQRPVYCEKCHGAMSALSSLQNRLIRTVWCCEFCGRENSLSEAGLKASLRRPLPGRDVLYLSEDADGDYVNLEDMLVVFCVDISGSMSVTSEVTAGSSMRSPTYVSRLQSVQDALQRSLSSLLQTSPQRRVALVTFNDEVTVYGDGTGVPLSLRDWSLMDYDYLKTQGEKYSTPHCIAESIHALTQRVKELREHGATALGPAALLSIAMASRYTGSKVIICTDGRANIGLGELEQSPVQTSPYSPYSPYFYSQLAKEAADSGVIVSVLTFEGTDCRLAEVGRLADHTGGKVNIVNISTVSMEIQSVLADNILATSVKATLLSAEGIYFPYEDESAHKLVREIGNVTEGAEITFQFAVKPDSIESFQKRDRIPFQLQLEFKTRELQKVTRIVTDQRRVTSSRTQNRPGFQQAFYQHSRSPGKMSTEDRDRECERERWGQRKRERKRPGEILRPPLVSWPYCVALNLNMGVLGVHCAQLCARLTMEGRVLEAQRQLRAQQDLLKDISEQRPSPKEESVYGNWISTMSVICEDLTGQGQVFIDGADTLHPRQTDRKNQESKDLVASKSSPVKGLSDEAAKVVYQMKRAKSVGGKRPKAQPMGLDPAFSPYLRTCPEQLDRVIGTSLRLLTGLSIHIASLQEEVGGARDTCQQPPKKQPILKHCHSETRCDSEVMISKIKRSPTEQKDQGTHMWTASEDSPSIQRKSGMAQARSFLSREQLQCSICLEVFTNPATTPCGHSFCMACIGRYWDSNRVCQCPLCKETFTKRPYLHINCTLKDITEMFKVLPGRTGPVDLAQSAHSPGNLSPVRLTLSEPAVGLQVPFCQKHHQPLEVFCQTEEAFVCTECLRMDHQDHNTISASTEWLVNKSQIGTNQAEMQEMIMDRLKKMEELKTSLAEINVSVERETQGSMRVFKALAGSMEWIQAELLEVIQRNKTTAEQHVQGLISELEQEIGHLRKRSAILTELTEAEDFAFFLKSFPTLCTPPLAKDWSGFSVNSDLCVVGIHRKLSLLADHFLAELRRLPEMLDVTFDGATAHPKLILSEDRKQVWCGGKLKAVPDNPERFDRVICILAHEGFTGGKHYWEVDVGDKTDWDIGVASQPVQRKGKITFNPSHGYWFLSLRDKNKFSFQTEPSTSNNRCPKLKKIGVFLDYENGQVSFYNVHAKLHIYTFTDTFSKTVYPFFSPCGKKSGKNEAPLIITPVS